METEQNKANEEENEKKCEISKFEDENGELENLKIFEKGSIPIPNAVPECDNEHFKINTGIHFHFHFSKMY